MADSSRHTSTFPELCRLYNSLRSSRILGSTIVAQNVLRDPALLVHSNSHAHPTPENSLPTSTTPLNKRIHPRDRNPGLYAVVQGATQIFTASAVAPFERVYIRMQCQNEMLKQGLLSRPYKGITDCFLRTIKHEGLLSLWRGNSINVIIPVTLQASWFTLYLLRPNTNRYPSQEVKERPLWALWLPGMFGLLFIYPLSYARIRLGNDVKTARNLSFSLDSSSKSFCNAAGNWKFNGVFDVFKKTLQLEGTVGLYRGYSVACLGIFAYWGSSRLKSQYREILEKREKEKPPKSSAVIALLVFLSIPVVNVVFYPVRTISHRMMMTSGEITKYKGAVDAVHQIVKHEGVPSLFKGLTAYLMYDAAKLAVMSGVLYLLPSKTDKRNKQV